MRIALLSDIHGNLLALEAVVDDLQRRRVDRVVNLGDSLSGFIQPRECAAYLMQQPWVQLAGNHERQILESEEGSRSESDLYARSTLDAGALRWLATLPGTARIEEDVLLCHGTPDSDCENFLEIVEPAGTRLATPAEIARRLGNRGQGAALIACGHTHVPRAVRREDGTLIVNPGSVGLPAFEASRPYPHVVQNGAPDARYAIVEKRGGRWSVELRAVPYDHLTSARIARAHGRADWATILSTGYVAARDPTGRGNIA
jgi:predicted phosphodiesterase